ncbi:ubiquitin-conjugating enzyme E2Q-like protein CG4502 [Patiria miniata]|uniref:UBC core domain-containing protein n=1 Tax=Patiria miniata TaxID=46514 RepID=A0A914AZZ9_PATMI|nr:ubiquitin-conjugating enzyme E2Q-like protein CG4502 [Patiria miniata]
MEVDEKATDFDACRQAALAWLEHHSKPWQLLWADETERQLVFEHRTGGISFNIVVQSSAAENGQRCFKVASDNDSAWQLLKECQGTSIQECLEQSTAALQPLVGSHNTGTEDDEGVDEDDDDEDEDDDENEDWYYENNEDMMDTEEPEKVNRVSPEKRKSPEEHGDTSDVDFEMYAKFGSRMAVRRLLSDLKMFKRSESANGIHGSPRGDNLFLWDVQMTDFEPKSVLGKDLCKYADKYKQKLEIQLEMSFPDDYPMAPPFIRVVRPRFKFLTAHVTIGGSICMELLTKSGWRPTNDIESILVQVRSEIVSDPKAALDMDRANREYTKTEAETAFHRMVQRYGWNK